MVKQFGLKRVDGFDKAIARVLTGTPSQLGRAIVNDICPGVTPLQGCHCADIVLGIWRRSLPTVVRNAVADMDFTAASYNLVFDKADSTWSSNKAATSVISSLDKKTVAAATAEEVEVAAAGPAKKKNNKNNKNKNQNQGGGKKKPKRGPRHADLPPMDACDTHFTYGKGAWFCADRHSCPWRDFENPKPRHNRNIAGAEMLED